MPDTHDYILLGVIAAGTAATRFLPFLLFPAGRKKPRWLLRLSNVLPSAAIAMLVVYCLKGIYFTKPQGFLPELIALVVVSLLHLWKRQPLLSIGGGTICYMILVQQVF
ncbi:MAG TPA: branched-chain amino acid transporter AzlD [Clostridiaceae bacterium]|jgi:branched-subunit amino acid transport protein AzlD|nr:branched-chain amino acid transporter AzlD [Clostridiaceae bacterium]